MQGYMIVCVHCERGERMLSTLKEVFSNSIDIFKTNKTNFYIYIYIDTTVVQLNICDLFFPASPQSRCPKLVRQVRTGYVQATLFVFFRSLLRLLFFCCLRLSFLAVLQRRAQRLQDFYRGLAVFRQIFVAKF